MKTFINLPAFFTANNYTTRKLILAILTWLLLVYPFAVSYGADQKKKIQRLDESCWRDDVTGDWIIGIYPEGVVYDSKFWEYTGRDEKNGQYLLHNDACEILSIKIGNERMAEPTLSELALKNIREEALADAASSLGQLRSNYPFDKFPREESDYIRKTFWNCLTQPISLYPIYMWFMKDFVSSELFNSDYILMPKYGESYAILYTPKKVVEKVKPDHNFLQESIKDGSFNYLFLLPDTIKNTIERIHRRAGEILQSESLSPEEEFQYKDVLSHIDILNDLKASPEIMDIYLMMYCIDQMDHDVTPLSHVVKNSLDSVISFSAVKDKIHRHSDKYEKMKAKSKSFEFSISNGDEVRDINDGRALFEKLVEPYRGKFVLIDIWGTWCGPCKEAMKEFVKEYETLSPYEVAFLYFANNSEDKVIKTVVSGYNVTGENVLHYNLPEKQQKALEEYLNVNGSYPTYILVDPEGHIVKDHVDVRDLESQEKIIKVLSSKAT